MELGRGEGRAKDMTWLVSGRAVWKDLRSPAIAAFFFSCRFLVNKVVASPFCSELSVGNGCSQVLSSVLCV